MKEHERLLKEKSPVYSSGVFFQIKQPAIELLL
jgi:hypothetical protein